CCRKGCSAITSFMYVRMNCRSVDDMRMKIKIACLIAIFVHTPVFAAQKTPNQSVDPLFQSGTIEGFEMIAVKGGCFQMGSNFGAADEKPAHEVCVDDFYIGRYEVTQGQWLRVMEVNPAYFDRGDNYPVEQVSWNDVQKFIYKLNLQNETYSLQPEVSSLSEAGRSNRKSGKFRLPTEAEWEYACRSGGKKEEYCGGENVDALAWYESNSGSATHPVGTRQPNGLGIYDMSGNVWEWSGDWFDTGYYAASPRDNPKGSNFGKDRVFRGGSWNFKAKYVRSASRFWLAPADRHYFLGFRLVLSTGGN
ncbi:MAG: formylglycine-generating enzyme family protein, partial [Proteobacteria bacterium]|nr:formylglycine-generating enzyme family protein [Pseudomonadota bacterium]